jgi:hypothetical protein
VSAGAVEVGELTLLLTTVRREAVEVAVLTSISGSTPLQLLIIILSGLEVVRGFLPLERQETQGELLYLPTKTVLSTPMLTEEWGERPEETLTP